MITPPLGQEFYQESWLSLGYHFPWGSLLSSVEGDELAVCTMKCHRVLRMQESVLHILQLSGHATMSPGGSSDYRPPCSSRVGTMCTSTWNEKSK